MWRRWVAVGCRASVGEEVRQINIVSITGNKRCIWCHVEKNISLFYRWNRSLDGYRNYCKECSKKKGWNRGRHNYEKENINEANERRELTDRIVKRTIYIGEHNKGNKAFSFKDITPDMIITVRNRIIQRRKYQTGKEVNPKALSCVAIARPCNICGILFIARAKNVSTCSVPCRNESERRKSFEHSKAKKVLHCRTCKHCGQDFIPKYGNKKRVFCSSRCVKRFSQLQRENGNHRKRAKKYHVKYEYINRVKVFDRDGWTCQICGKKTPMERKGSRYSNAPELDHRVPMSLGGGHLYSNVQCACRACNSRKSNRSSLGQLPLFSIRTKAGGFASLQTGALSTERVILR